jgi:signal transduction histidine kinase
VTGVVVALVALSVSTVTGIVIGAVGDVTRYYWVDAAVWGAGVIIAVGVAVVSAARLIGQRDLARDQARLQVRVADALARAATLSETTSEILRALGEALELDLIVAWRADEKDQRLRFVELWSVPELDVDAFRRDSERVEFERGQGVLGEAWRRGSPRVAVLSRGGFRRQALLDTLGFDAVVMVPFWQGGSVVGVLEGFTMHPDLFDREMIDLLGQIGRQIGVAYERAARLRMLQEAQEQRGYVLGRLLRAEEESRANLASDLHDDTIQVMAAALISLERLTAAIDQGDLDRASRALHSATDALRAATERTRHVTFALRPAVLIQHGLGAAARALLEDASAVAHFTFDVKADTRRYPRLLEGLCYRILQEAVANIRKHAQAEHVTVSIRQQDGAVHCTITDDGVGFDLDEALDRDRMRLHIGLESMRERAVVAGGSLDITTHSGAGTVLAFVIPIDSAAPAEVPV